MFLSCLHANGHCCTNTPSSSEHHPDGVLLGTLVLTSSLSPVLLIVNVSVGMSLGNWCMAAHVHMKEVVRSVRCRCIHCTLLPADEGEIYWWGASGCKHSYKWYSYQGLSIVKANREESSLITVYMSMYGYHSEGTKCWMQYSSTSWYIYNVVCE